MSFGFLLNAVFAVPVAFSPPGAKVAIVSTIMSARYFQSRALDELFEVEKVEEFPG